MVKKYLKYKDKFKRIMYKEKDFDIETSKFDDLDIKLRETN